MHKMFGWAPGLGVRVLESTRVDSHWTILALTEGLGVSATSFL